MTRRIQHNIFFGLLKIIILACALSVLYPIFFKSPELSYNIFIPSRVPEIHPQRLQTFLYLVFAFMCPLYALFLSLQPLREEDPFLISLFPYLSKIKFCFIDYILPF